jgi:hypothetical protein
MSWPTIATPAYGSEGESLRPQIRSEMEGGYAQTRAMYTRATKKFRLHWNALSTADLTLLISAYESDAGNSFTWTDLDGTSRTVRYVGDSLRWVYAYPGYFTVDVELEEV